MLFAFLPSASSAAALEDRGRFCSYGPIIDLLPGERIVTVDGGIHGGTFDWTGSFGTLHVYGIQWASKPKGVQAARRTIHKHIRFLEKRDEDRRVVAIWNGRQGVAYFSSSLPITAAQLKAIDRVDLFQEGEEPKDCNLRTVFSWD